jgi:hypothetical protein
MANIGNITLALILAASMAGAFVQRQGYARINGVTAIIFVQNN